MQASSNPSQVVTSVKPFGVTDTGEEVECITLSNRQSNELGVEVDLINLGATIHRIRAPDWSGQLKDVVLYCQDVPGYQQQNAFLGASIGRYANRIGRSEFELDGTCYHLSANEGINHLHGGQSGFDKRVWRRQNAVNVDSSHVLYRLVSESGDQGYPGQLQVDIDYRLTENNRLIIDIKARTDEPSYVNLTNHAYFNLSGDLYASIEGHHAIIPSRQVCALDEQMIPTGEIDDISGTPLDFRYSGDVYQRVKENAPELRNSKGFDHCYVFDDDRKLKLLAMACHRFSGRRLAVYSTHPGLQFYTGNHLGKAQARGPRNESYQAYGGFCFEAQHLPDSPHHQSFPSTRLDPGQLYHQQIIYQIDLV